MKAFSLKQKLFTLTLLASQLFFVVAAPAEALFGGLKIPSASSIATDLEKRYNLDLENIQDQGQLFNVAANKQPAPEVSLYFSPTDPRPGEKITAKAFPVYFSNKEESLYYAWYIKRQGCDLDSSPSGTKEQLCDRDSDNRITVEDWKIEAMQTVAQNGYDSSQTNYGSDTDDDGYKARYGGDNKTNTPSYCYYHDSQTGLNYELADTGNTSFSCPSGQTAVCMIEEVGFEPSTIPGNTAGNSADGETFTLSDTDECVISGLPVCNSGGAASCASGEPRCVTEPETDSTLSCGTPLASCNTTTSAQANPYCKHLFPDATGGESGDGVFGASEERFWRTDPNDPDTADNGNKDEANVIGFGQTSLTWNYIAGDQVGVAVEGSSMIPTKHDNSSLMIMWAFPKQDCPLSVAEGTGSYTKRIKNYSVEIETADIDLNDCLERNLIDPTMGGQATNLEVSVSASQNEPLNDESGDGSGDLLLVSAAVSNGKQSIASSLFEWNVELSNNIQFSSAIGPTANVTKDLQNAELLSATKGNALDGIRLKLDMLRNSSLGGRPLSGYLVNDIGYLRFSSRVSENFESGIIRKGKSDVIVKFVSTGRKIVATRVNPVLINDKMLVTGDVNGVICNDDTFDRNLCRVIKNEIIGLRVDDNGLSNFQWSINGDTLSCSQSRISPDCLDSEQNEINFFPVTGDAGDTYTVNLTANDTVSGKVVTLARSFRVIEPVIDIVSTDESIAWPKFLGQYRDITGKATSCIDGLCDDYSKDVIQTYENSAVNVEAKFVPSFLANIAEREWYINDALISEVEPNKTVFDAAATVGSVMNLQIVARVTQSDELRRALYDIWNVSPLDSPEIAFSKTTQIEVVPEDALAKKSGPTKYFAAIVNYVPTSLIFAFRVLLSGVLILFAVAFLMGSLPQERPLRKE
jgi:hypothetical protein